MSETALEKTALRVEARRARRALPDALWKDASEKIVERVLALVAVSGVRSVATFWPMLERHEVDVRPLGSALAAKKIQVAYPWMGKGAAGDYAAEFRFPLDGGDFTTHVQGFRQPADHCEVARQLDWIVVPALAVTRRGERLGYGAGYYDRMLGRFPTAQTVVVAYHSELKEQLPRSDHDRCCRWVVTEEETLRAEA